MQHPHVNEIHCVDSVHSPIRKSRKWHPFSSNAKGEGADVSTPPSQKEKKKGFKLSNLASPRKRISRIVAKRREAEASLERCSAHTSASAGLDSIAGLTEWEFPRARRVATRRHGLQIDTKGSAASKGKKDFSIESNTNHSLNTSVDSFGYEEISLAAPNEEAMSNSRGSMNYVSFKKKESMELEGSVSTKSCSVSDRSPSQDTEVRQRPGIPPLRPASPKRKTARSVSDSLNQSMNILDVFRDEEITNDHHSTVAKENDDMLDADIVAREEKLIKIAMANSMNDIPRYRMQAQPTGKKTAQSERTVIEEDSIEILADESEEARRRVEDQETELIKLAMERSLADIGPCSIDSTTRRISAARREKQNGKNLNRSRKIPGSHAQPSRQHYMESTGRLHASGPVHYRPSNRLHASGPVSYNPRGASRMNHLKNPKEGRSVLDARRPDSVDEAQREKEELEKVLQMSKQIF